MSLIQEAPLAPTIAVDPAEANPRPYEFTAEAFERMIVADVFADEDRVELWDGRIYHKMAKTNAYAATGIKVGTALATVRPPGWCLSVENPVALGPKSTPLPDFTLLRGEGDDYAARRPTPLDVGLIVEVAVTSVKQDSTTRLAHSAGAGVPCYWVVNVVANVILVYEQPIPAEGRYESSQTIAAGQTVPLRLDGVLVAEIPALDLLPIPR